MWFCDLEKAIGKVIDFLGANACMVCIDKINPSADGGIVFYLSDRSRVKWFQDGTIVRKEEGDWRK